MGEIVKQQGRPSTKRVVHSSILIFTAGMILTIMLWDSYFNRAEPLGRGITSFLIFIMGTLFSISAGLFSWSIETRGERLEKEVTRRTRELNDKNNELSQKNQEIENFITP